MKTAPVILLLVLLSCVYVSQCTDLVVGTSYQNRLVFQQKAEYNAIPLKKRVKEFFYTDPAQQIIKGVVARDLDHTAAQASITAGGVGFPYVNIKLKSERGSGLNYQIEVYV